MQSFNSLQKAAVKQGFLPVGNLIIFLASELSSFSIGFKNINVELEWASLKPVRETDFMLRTKFLLLRNFVCQNESFENIKIKSLFTTQS